MAIKIQELREFSSKGVYALINASKKRVYIGFGVNMLNSLTRLIGDLNTNKDYAEMASDVEDLSAVILETNEGYSPGALRVRVGHWVAKYKAEGWGLYREYAGMTYVPRLTTDVSGRTMAVLTRPGCKPIVVGVFVRRYDAELFLKLNYEGKEILEPIYAKNEHTKNWRLKNGDGPA